MQPVDDGGCHGPYIDLDTEEVLQAPSDAEAAENEEAAGSDVEDSEEAFDERPWTSPEAQTRRPSVIKDEERFRQRLAEIEAAALAARRPSIGAFQSLTLSARFLPKATHRVRFTDLEDRRHWTKSLTVRAMKWLGDRVMKLMEAVETYWANLRRPLVVVTGLFELWSMGIWIGFMTEPKMADSLKHIAILDIVCNVLYMLDNVMSIGTFYLEERRRRRALEADSRHHRHRIRELEEQDRNEGAQDGEGLSFLWTPWSAIPPARQHQLKVYFGLVLAIGMVPVQVLLYEILDSGSYIIWQVLLVILFRFTRVLWGFRACASLINQQELEVYVDIRMHGTSGSSWNRVRILAKQFLVVLFFGHWFGCLSHAVAKVGSVLQHNIRVIPDTTRDYFSQFRDKGNVAFEPGEDFWQSYLLALYRGFNLNIEDILPERPIELLMEVFISMMILLMKSYCIGSFFKYHQRREFEVQKFRQLMVSVTQFLDLYEVPPSLRKAVIGHFRFQQSNHQKMQTLEVIAKLPAEVQKKLKEQEVLPTVVDRNPLLFGTSLSRDFCVQISIALGQRFLQPSEVIFMEDEVPRELVFLDSGAVALSRGCSTEGQRTEQLLRYVRADRKDDASALGAVSLILGSLHFYSARVRAGNEAITLNMSRDEFEELKVTFPDQHDQLIRNIQETYGPEAENIVGTDENERFAQAHLQEVRKALQARQDSLNAAFTYAASKGDVKLVQELLRKRMNPNVADYDMRSALHLAASEGMSEVLETILEYHGDANMKDRWGSTPLQDALKNGYVGAAKIVHKHGGRLDLADPAAAICTYASEGNTFAMQQLIDFRVDPNVGDYDSRTALHLSASEGHLPVVTFLTMRKADVNAKDRWRSTPVQDAVRNGFATVASHLRSQGGRVDSQFVANQLCDAASTGDLPMLKMLHETGVDVNAGDYDARTALHLAASEGQVLALNYLVNTAQALHSPVDRWGSTPLQDALVGGHSVCVQLLLACGAGLGPSADRVARQTVQNLATEMGFRNGGILAFSETSGNLRRRLRAHMALVDQGKARSDIFNMEEAQRFNMQVVIAAFGRMHGLKEEARWFIQLLQQLEPASESIWQVLRLLRDGVGLVREARHWSEAAQLDGTAKRRTQRRSKDASDMAFHGAFLASQRFVPMIQEALTATTQRVLARAALCDPKRRRHSHSSQRSSDSQEGADGGGGPGDAPSVAALVVNELFNELGWAGHLQQRHKVARYAGSDAPGLDQPAGGLREDAMTRRGVTGRLEEQARLLLPAEHLTWTLHCGPLRLHGSGAPHPGGEDGAFPRSAAFDALRAWLERRTRLVLSGKVAPAEPPPAVPPGARPQDVLACLLPRDADMPPRAFSSDSLLSPLVSPKSSLRRGASRTSNTSLASPPPSPLNRGTSRTSNFSFASPSPSPVRQVPSRTSSASFASPSPSPSPRQPRTAMVATLRHVFTGSALRVVTAPVPVPSPEVPEVEKSTGEGEAIAYLLATELVLMALAALILEGWDQGSRYGGREEEGEEQAVGRLLRGSRASSRGVRREERRSKLTQEDFQELGAIFRRAARACRGRDGEAEQLAKKAAKVQAAVRQGQDADDTPMAGGSDKDGGSQGEKAVPDETVESVESKPIRLARILALQDKMSTDELALLISADDGVHNREDVATRAFGEVSRERFALDLLRILVDHESTHSDVMAKVERRRREREDALERRALESSSNVIQTSPTSSVNMRYFRFGSELSGNLSDLYNDIDRLHEDLSEGSDNHGVGFAGNNFFYDNVSEAMSRFNKGEDANAPQSEDTRSFMWWARGHGGGGPAAKGGTSPSTLGALEQGLLAPKANQNGMRGSASESRGSLLIASQVVHSHRPGWCMRALVWMVQLCSAEGRERRKRQHIAKRFKELDDDGEGIGTAEVAQLLAVAFRHTLGAEGELRWAYRAFELLNKADVGDLVTLPEFLSVLPKLTEEIKTVQRKNNRREVTSGDAAIGPVARFAAGLVITPDSPFGHLWDRARRAVVVYYMFEVPMRFCFLSRSMLPPWAAVSHLMVSSIADCFMGLNILLTFFRAFVHPTLGVISAFQDIRMHYLLGRFPIDFVACVPVDWWLPEENGEDGLFARPRAAVRLLKLLHMHYLRHVQVGTLEESAGFHGEALTMSLGVWMLVHFLACIWWLIGTRYPSFDPQEAYNQTHTYDPHLHDGRGSWTFSYMHRPNENPIGDWSGHTPYWWQYLTSYYISIGKVTSQCSSGNIYVGSWLELAWICAMFFLSVAVNGYCDGILVDTVIAGDEQFIEGEAMRRILDEYLHTAELPLELAQEVRSSAKLSSKMVAWRRMEETIAALPHSLKQRVARRTVMPRIVAQEVFTPCSESFLLELGTHFRIVAAGSGQVLVRPGEPSSQLAILNFGRVAAMDGQYSILAESNTPLDLIEEMPFIFNLKHNFLVTVLEETQLTVLPRAGFVVTCKMYPEDAMTLRRSAMKAVQTVTDESEDRRDDDDQKSRAGHTKAKSAMSFGTSLSKQSKTSTNSSMNTFLRRGYVRELQLVADKLREEEAAARQDIICKFVQKAADGEVAVVASMLAKGEVLVDEGDYDQRTALHLAVCNGHMEVIKLLIEKHHGAMHLKDRFNHTPVEDALREKKVDILRYLVGRGAQYQADTNVAAQLCQAAHDGDVATLKLLIEVVGCSPSSADYDKRTALHLAACEGHMAVVELLVKSKGIELSPLDRLGNTPLDDAMRHKHLQVRRYLHSKGARMGDRNMGVALCSLAAEDDVDGLRDLADSEVDLNQGDYDSRTALHLAASDGRKRCVTYLLIEARVEPNPLDRFLNTPLDDAIRHEHTAMEALLRDAGGLRGSDPRMAGAVAKFKEEKVVQEAQAVKRKLEKEVQGCEVSTIMAALKRFREHPTMEDDVHAFVTHAANFRDLLLRLLSWSSGPIDPLAWVQSGEDSSVLLTKNNREQLLQRTCAELEGTLDRLTTMLDAEVMPWLAGLSKTEARLLRVLVPDLKPAVSRIVEQLRGGARFRKFVRHLWNEKGPGGGAYQCLPVGLLLQRRSAELGHRVRLEAEALLWATGTTAGQPGVGRVMAEAPGPVQEYRASTTYSPSALRR